MVFLIFIHRQIISNPGCVSRSSRSTRLHHIDHLQNHVFGFGEVAIDAKKKESSSPPKSDKDNATGDVQLLCKLFSGERCSYSNSTEESRVIPANALFSILGSTQLLNAAKLVTKMDHRHRLVDWMLIETPLAYRPNAFGNGDRGWSTLYRSCG